MDYGMSSFKSIKFLLNLTAFYFNNIFTHSTFLDQQKAQK